MLRNRAFRFSGVLAFLLVVLSAGSLLAASGSGTQNWQVYAINPWIEANAEQLAGRLTKTADSLALSGPRNDWLTGAVAIASDDVSKVRVSLLEPDALSGRVSLRVLGIVKQMDGDALVYDPIISKEDLPDYAKEAANFEEIKDFPNLKVTSKTPAFLWLTVDLTGVKSGSYEAKLIFEDDLGNKKVTPVNISVLDAELPVESPLPCIGWQWWNSDRMIKDFVQHGVNVAWRNHEQAWKNGAQFLLFQFSSTFQVGPLTDERKAEIQKELADIWATVERLKVPIDRWAINTNDEVSDSTAQQTLVTARYIKSLRPETPIWQNPAWGQQADSNQNWTTTDGCLKVIAPIVDVWCPYSWHLWDKTAAFSFMKSTGKRMWYYEIWGCASRRPSVGRETLRTGPMMAWKYDLTGWGVFCANDWPDNPWSGKLEHTFTYPGANGRLISSRGFEAIRQGTQEYKRLYMIRKIGGRKTKPLTDSWVDMSLSAESVEVIDAVRAQMDKTLVALYASKHKK